MPCSWITSVTTESRKPRSCETTSAVDGHALSQCISQSTAGKSKWLVGSSSRRRSHGTNSAAARLARIRQPPERLLSGAAIIGRENWSPARIVAARASAVSVASSARRVSASARRLARRAATFSFVFSAFALSSSARAALGGGSAAARATAARYSSTRLVSTRASRSNPSTVCSAERLRSSVGSCSTCTTFRCAGKPVTPYDAIAFSRVVLPVPLRPTSPYLRPSLSRSGESSMRALPFGASRIMLRTATSREPPPAFESK